MKKNIITATGFFILMNTCVYAEDKATVVGKKETATPAKKAQTLSTANVIGDSQVTINASVGVVESFTVMGEGSSGQIERHNMEIKQDLARQELQEEAKKLEKAKADYIAKASTMSESALKNEEAKLTKMDRDLKYLASEKEEALKRDMQAATEILAHELEMAVAQLAENNKLDIVFDKMTGRIIYVSDKFDYTAETIAEVNKNYEVKLAQNKQPEQAALKVAENKAVAAPKQAKVGA